MLAESRLRSALGWLMVPAAGATWGALAARLLAETTLVRPWIEPPVQLLLLGLGAGTVTWSVRRWASPAAALPLFLGLVYLAQPSTDLLQGWTMWATSVLLAVLVSARRVPRHAGWLVSLAALGLYLTTMPTTVGAADTFEFQVTAQRMGIAHPTGYPLYLLLGWLFSRLPVGSVAWRMNLTSVCAAVATIGLVFALLWRLWDSSRTPAWVRAGGSGLAAVTLGVSPAFWSQAVVAEVYALNTLLVALLVWLVVQAPTDRSLWLVALVLGLSLSHHLTAVLLLPAMVVALAPALWERRRRPRFWLVGAGSFLLGLTPYLYLPLRWPAFHQGRVLSWPEFWGWVTGARFHGALQLDAWLRDPSRYGIVARLLRDQVGWAGLALASVGLAWTMWRRPRLGVASLLAWLGYVFYALNYRVPDLGVFLLPAVLVLCLWLGIGTLALVRMVDVEGVRIAALSAAVLLPLSLLWSQFPQVNRSAEGQALEAWARYALAQPLAPDAAILADAEKFAPLYYLNQVVGARPDLEVVLLPDEAAYRTELATRLTSGQVVYLARYLPGLEATHHLRSVGPLVEVATAPQTALPADLDALAVEFGDQVRLLGARVEGSNPLRVTLAWQRIGPADALTTRLQVVDGTGESWARMERIPVAGLYPTNAWKEDEVVTDYYEVTLAEATPPGRLVLEVGMGRPFALQGLPVNGTQQDAFPVADVVRSFADLPSPLQGREGRDGTASPEARRVLFDGRLALIGVSMPSVAPASAPAQVRLYWSSPGSLPEYVFRLVPRCGSRAISGPLQWGKLSTSEWPDDQVVITRHALDLPSGGGPCEIELGLERGGNAVGWRPAWWPLEKEWHSLGLVEPEPENLATFGGRVALVDAGLDTPATVPGGPVQVSLMWRGLGPMVEDYTVFVQALGPDGKLYGQDDRWPVAGTFPTSQWSPGRVVEDTHHFVLRADAPPGQYRVIAGWYLLSTMERLPVRDVGGRNVADFVEVGVLNVTE